MGTMKKLGKGYCGECDSNSKVLIIKKGEIWSKCKRCGFMEWEWQTGDGMDYLRYLADRYNVSLKEILKALEE
jgi:hypothetical protein